MNIQSTHVSKGSDLEQTRIYKVAFINKYKAFVADMTRIKDTSKMRICGIPISVFDNLNDFDRHIVAQISNNLVKTLLIAGNSQQRQSAAKL